MAGKVDKFVLRAQLLTNEFIYIRLNEAILSDPSSESYTTTGYPILATTFPTRKIAKAVWRLLTEHEAPAIEFEVFKLND